MSKPNVRYEVRVAAGDFYEYYAIPHTDGEYGEVFYDYEDVKDAKRYASEMVDLGIEKETWVVKITEEKI